MFVHTQESLADIVLTLKSLLHHSRRIVVLTSHMATHPQAALNGQYYAQHAVNESQPGYYRPYQPPQHQQQLQQQQGHAPQSHFQSHSTSQPQPQPDGANAAYRHPSFIGLPPISRASTFSSLLRPFQAEGDSAAGDNNSTYGDAADATPRNSVQYSQQGQQQGGHQTVVATPQQTVSETTSRMAANQTAGGVQPPHGHQFSTPSPPPGQFIQNMYRPTQGPAQGQQMQSQQGQPLPNGFSSPPLNGSMTRQSPAQTQPGLPGPPGNAQGQPGSAPAGAPGAPLSALSGGAPAIAPQLTPANGQAPVMMPPPHLAGRFPQGNWNLQESHLSEPLQPTNRHRHSPSNASQQPFYGFDKETGVPASPRSSQRPSDAGLEPEIQPVGQNGQGPQLNGQENNGNHIEQQRPRGKSLSQTNNVNIDDLPAPGPIPAADGNRARRNSGLFSSLRNRVGTSHGTPVTSDAVSDASVMTDETGGQQQRRGNPMFSALGAAAGTDAPQSKESIIAHGSTTPVNGGPTSPPPQQHQQHHQHQPKKSRMGLKAMFSRSSQQQEVHRTFGNAQEQSARPTTQQGQPQGQQHQAQQQPMAMSGANPMSPLRPKTAGQQVPQQHHQSLAAIAENEKARKPSGGIFGMFKSKDAKLVPGNNAAGGQQIMDPRQTLQQGMGRGQMAFPPSGQVQGQFPQQQQQQQQQYRQQFPVGPDGKLVMFPGQLPPQHFMQQQGGHPGMQPLQQMQMQGQMPGQQRPQPNIQQPQQVQNGGPQGQPQQQHQQPLDPRQGQPNGQNIAPNGSVSPPVASPVPSEAEQSRPPQSTPPTSNGQASPAGQNGGHGRTFSQGSNLPNMYTMAMNGNQPSQAVARKPVGSRVVSAQIPPSLMPQQQQQRQRGASVSSTQSPPQPQSPPSTQPPSSLGTQRPSDSQHTLASQGGKSLPDIPTSTHQADRENRGAQDQQKQGQARQQQQPQPVPSGPQGPGQGPLNQNPPPPGQGLPRATTMGPGFPVQQQQQQPPQLLQKPQQPSPNFPPRNVMTTSPPPKEKEQSTISKLFRGVKHQASPSTAQDKGKSSFMSAFKRGGDSKQGETQKSPAQSPQVNQGQFQSSQQPQKQQGLQPPQSQQPGQPQQQGQQQQQESRPALGDRRPSPHLQYQNERQDPSKAPSPPALADLATRPPAQQQPSQQPSRPSVTSTPGAAPNPSRPVPQTMQQPQQMVQGQPGPAPGLVQGQQRPPVPGQPMHPSQMTQAQAQAFAQQQFFQAQAHAHAQAQMFQRFQQQQAQLAAQQGQAQQRPGQPATQAQGQNPATSGPPGQEQRYAQVPIPAGYPFVQQGMATPSPMGMPMPYFINVPGQPPQYFMPMPGQMIPPGMPGMSPQMLPPGFVPGQPFMYTPPHPGGPMPPGSMPPGPPGSMPMATPPPGSMPMATPPTAGTAGTPTPFFTPPTSVGGPQQPMFFQAPVQPSSPPPGSEHSAQQGPPSISPTPPPFIGQAKQASNISPQPQTQQGQGQFQQPPPPQSSPSPPNYPLPNTPFSPVNPDAPNIPNPPLPVSPEPSLQQQQEQHNPGLIPQRQVSQVSAMSMPPSNGSPSLNVISPISNDSGVTIMPDGQQQQLSRSGSAAAGLPPADSRTVSPEPSVNVGQPLDNMGSSNHDVDKDAEDSKKADNHHDHHQWNATAESVTDSRAVSPEPASLLDEHHLHDHEGPMTPPPTTVSFIRAQAQEVHVHRSPDRPYTRDENNIYDATPRQSIKSPVLPQGRDSVDQEEETGDGYGFPRTTIEKEEPVTASAGKKVSDAGLSDIREESTPESVPEKSTGNSHFIVAPAPVDGVDDDFGKPAEPTIPAQKAPIHNGEAHHGHVGRPEGVEKDNKPAIASQSEHVEQKPRQQQQHHHIADLMVVSPPVIGTAQSADQHKRDVVDYQQPPPQPQLQQQATAAAPSPPPAPSPAPAVQQPQQQQQQHPQTMLISPSPSPSPTQTPEPSKSQPDSTTTNGNGNGNGVIITTASGFPPNPSNPKGIVKPLTDKEIFDQAKRRQEEAMREQLLRAQEEKIPVFDDDHYGNNPNGNGTGPGGKKKDENEDAVPMMSATSYPGQEWNPYGGFGGGDGEGWDD